MSWKKLHKSKRFRIDKYEDKKLVVIAAGKRITVTVDQDGVVDIHPDSPMVMSNSLFGTASVKVGYDIKRPGR